MRATKRSLLLLGILFLGMWLPADDNIIYAKGEGRTSQEAINSALFLAVEQNCGIVLSGTERTLLTESVAKITTNKGDVSKIELQDAIRKTLDKVAKGRILSFEIVNDQIDPQTHRHQVEIKAVLPGKYTLGIDTSNRRKIAMLPLSHHCSNYPVGDRKTPAARLTEDLQNGFNRHFTQSRRFSVLTRMDQKDLAREKWLIEHEAPAAEWRKLGQTLGLDYMVTGSVSNLCISPLKEATITITGTRVNYIEKAYLEISYRVILVATGEIKWADTVRIDLLPQELANYGYDYGIIYNALIDAGIRGVAQILENIYPVRVATLLPDGQVVLDQGGSLLQPGMVYEVFREGKEIFQEATGESLGFAEESLCRVQIVRVTPKLSYAAIIPRTGNLTNADIQKGAVARLTQEYYDPQPSQQPQQPTAPVIKLPFD